MDPARRGFLKGRLRSAPIPARRPPWALPEAAFVARCERCQACVEHCPTRIVVPMDGRYPGVDFSRGECTFCAECVAHCPSGALDRQAGRPPWTLRAGIGPACLAFQGVECRVCAEACDARAIRFTPAVGRVSQPTVNPAQCTGCGACFGPCPVAAILMKPEEI